MPQGHYVIVVPDSPAARAAVYGSNEELVYFGNTVAAAPALLVDGGSWGMPAKSAGPPVQWAWGVWQQAVNLNPATPLLLAALAKAGTIQLFQWNPGAATTPETFAAYSARWQQAVAWVAPANPGVAATKQSASA